MSFDPRHNINTSRSATTPTESFPNQNLNDPASTKNQSCWHSMLIHVIKWAKKGTAKIVHVISRLQQAIYPTKYVNLEPPHGLFDAHLDQTKTRLFQLITDLKNHHIAPSWVLPDQVCEHIQRGNIALAQALMKQIRETITTNNRTECLVICTEIEDTLPSCTAEACEHRHRCTKQLKQIFQGVYPSISCLKIMADIEKISGVEFWTNCAIEALGKNDLSSAIVSLKNIQVFLNEEKNKDTPQYQTLKPKQEELQKILQQLQEEKTKNDQTITT